MPIAPRVLVVEDDPLVLRSIRRGLAPVALVVAANSVREALLLLRENSAQWDMVLLDGELGDGTALDVLAALPVPRLPVLVLTGSVDRTFRAALSRANVPVLEKPFEMGEVLAWVRERAP